MKFCPSCGEKLVEDAIFCPNCGKQVGKNSQSAEGASQQEINKPELFVAKTSPAESKSQGKKKKWWFVAGVAILLVASIGIMRISGFLNFNTGGKFEKILPQSKVKKDSQTAIFAYRNGDYQGIMNDKLEIISEKVGTGIVDFNDQGVSSFFVKDGDEDHKTGLISKTGEIIFEPESGTYFGDDRTGSVRRSSSANGTINYRISKTEDGEWTDKQGLIRSNGEIVYEPAEDTYIDAFEGRKYTTINERGRFGIISEDGELSIEIIYHDLTILTDKLIAAKKSEEDTLL